MSLGLVRGIGRQQLKSKYTNTSQHTSLEMHHVCTCLHMVSVTLLCSNRRCRWQRRDSLRDRCICCLLWTQWHPATQKIESHTHDLSQGFACASSEAKCFLACTKAHVQFANHVSIHNNKASVEGEMRRWLKVQINKGHQAKLIKQSSEV